MPRARKEDGKIPAVNVLWDTLEKSIRSGASDSDIGRAFRLITLRHMAGKDLVTDPDAQPMYTDEDTSATKFLYNDLVINADKAAENYKTVCDGGRLGNIAKNAGVSAGEIREPRTPIKDAWLAIYIRLLLLREREPQAYVEALLRYKDINKDSLGLKGQATLMKKWLDAKMHELGITDAEYYEPTLSDYIDMPAAGPRR